MLEKFQKVVAGERFWVTVVAFVITLLLFAGIREVYLERENATLIVQNEELQNKIDKLRDSNEQLKEICIIKGINDEEDENDGR